MVTDCGFPDIPGNGSIILTNTATTYGASATQLCNTGYTLNGTENITCGADGNWSEPAITCTILGILSTWIVRMWYGQC